MNKIVQVFIDSHALVVLESIMIVSEKEGLIQEEIEIT